MNENKILKNEYVQMVLRVLKSRQNIITDCLIYALFAVMMFVFLTNSPLHPWTGGETSADSSVFLTVSKLMRLGYMPYKDTFDHKGPLLFILNWIGDLISPGRGVWVVEYITLLLTCILLYKIALLGCRKKIWALVSALFAYAPLFTTYFGGNFTEEYAMPFICVALYTFLDCILNGNTERKRIMACGFSFACVFLLRANMISVWIVFCLSLLLLYKMPQIGQFLVSFLAGAALITVPVLLWLLINGALADFWRDYIVFNMKYIADSGFAGRWESFITFFGIPEVLVSLCATIYLLVKKNRFLYGVYLVYWGVTLWLICISGWKDAHYGMVLTPAIVFPVASLFGSFETGSEKGGHPAAMVFALYLLSAFIFPDWIAQFTPIVRQYHKRNAYEQPALIADFVTIIQNNTTEEEPITVYGNWNYMYLASNRLPATKYSYQFPPMSVSSQIADEYYAQLEQEKPKVFIIGENAVRTDRMNQFLDDNGYKLIYEDQERWVSLYLLRDE